MTCRRGEKICSQCRQGDEDKVHKSGAARAGWRSFLSPGHHQAATKECDGIAIDIDEGLIGVSEEAGHDGSARHA